MIALLQRVQRAAVRVDGQSIAAIDEGLCVFIGVTSTDIPNNAGRLAERVTAYRLFSDVEGRMNQSVASLGYSILAVPQFTLAADTASGNRPGFSTAAKPADAHSLFDQFVSELTSRHPAVVTGQFGADMQVELVNDGPVTFWLEG